MLICLCALLKIGIRIDGEGGRDGDGVGVEACEPETDEGNIF